MHCRPDLSVRMSVKGTLPFTMMTVFVRICLKATLAADPIAASLSTQLQLAFTDLKAAQVKTISFFTFLLRVTPSLLQPHKVHPTSARVGG